MSMDHLYQQWHHQVDDLHFRIKDAFDDRNHPAFRQVQDSIESLMNELEQQRSPRNIEVRIVDLMHLLEPARKGAQAFMSLHDAVAFYDTFERLRRDVHAHPHYN